MWWILQILYLSLFQVFSGSIQEGVNAPENESQYSTQINVKMSQGLKQALERLNNEHGVPPAELLRRLAQLAVDYELKTHELPLKHLRLMKTEPLSPETTKLERAQQHAFRKAINEGIYEDAQFSANPDVRFITPPRKPRTNGRGKKKAAE